MFLSFRHFFCTSHSWIGKKHAKESLVIYRNHALLLGFMKYFHSYVSYLQQLL